MRNFILLAFVFVCSCYVFDQPQKEETEFNMDNYGFVIEQLVKKHINNTKSNNLDLIMYLDSIFPQKRFAQKMQKEKSELWNHLNVLHEERVKNDTLLLSIDSEITDLNEEKVGTLNNYAYWQGYQVEGSWSRKSGLDVGVVHFGLEKIEGVDTYYPVLMITYKDQFGQYLIYKTAFYDLKKIDRSLPEWNEDKSIL